MYVCLCMSVTEDDIQKAIREGAKTIVDLQDKTGVGQRCGTCLDYIEQKYFEKQEKTDE